MSALPKPIERTGAATEISRGTNSRLRKLGRWSREEWKGAIEQAHRDNYERLIDTLVKVSSRA